MLDVILITPHLLAVLVVICWLRYGRRLKDTDSNGGAGESGEGGTRPPIPQLPLLGREEVRRDLARSA